jgi:hypothetical protein
VKLGSGGRGQENQQKLDVWDFLGNL